MLPNESLLDVLYFSDYNSLVAVKFVTAKFLHVATKFAAELPRQHSFLVIFYPAYVSYRDATIGARLKSIRYEPGNQQSLADACRDLGGVIGAHAVANVIFSENTWNMPGVGVVFEAAPALKYADELELNSREGSTIGNDSDAPMHNFTRLKTLHLLLDFDVFRHFSWTFLRQECARELRLIKGRFLREDERLNRCVEELVRDCVTLPRLLGGEALELDFSGNRLSAAFGLSIIKLLTNAGSGLTFRMSTPLFGGQMILDESDYTVEANDACTRYTSVKSGILVEMKGYCTLIQSSAEVLR